jgi:hypothetical protein
MKYFKHIQLFLLLIVYVESYGHVAFKQINFSNLPISKKHNVIIWKNIKRYKPKNIQSCIHYFSKIKPKTNKNIWKPFSVLYNQTKALDNHGKLFYFLISLSNVNSTIKPWYFLKNQSLNVIKNYDF